MTALEKSKTGYWGEILASRFLRDSGYEIINANYRTRLGEIDIIASDSHYIVFVEVKTRKAGSLGEPCEAVGRSKQAKIVRTASIYLSSNHSALQPRFDVIEVILKNNGDLLSINHIKNAFDMEAANEVF